MEKDECIRILCQRAQELGGLPQKADLDSRTVYAIKRALGPWPRALEEAGLKPVAQRIRLRQANRKRKKGRKGKTQRRAMEGKSIQEDIATLTREALDCGFSQAGELNVAALEFMPEVREMCSVDRCHQYGKNWRCPPGCGSIEEAAARAAQYSRGILVQTIAKMEDNFDYGTIEEAAQKHKRCFAVLVEKVRERHPDMLPMGAGTCDQCESCTYPDVPCRFPDKAFSSMEAYGLWVSRVCELSNVPYNNGPQTITYTSCYLLK